MSRDRLKLDDGESVLLLDEEDRALAHIHIFDALALDSSGSTASNYGPNGGPGFDLRKWLQRNAR